MQNTATQDLVAIIDGESFQQLFSAASPMRLSVREARRTTKYVVEDGSTRNDHIIIDPVEISIDLLLESEDARDGYAQIRQAWSENKLVTVQGTVSSYKNMLITDIPHEVSPQFGLGIAIPMKLVEWRSDSPQFGTLPPSKVASKKQSSTAKGGQKATPEANEPTKRRSSTAYRIFN